jgi:hypothetical protein
MVKTVEARDITYNKFGEDRLEIHGNSVPYEKFAAILKMVIDPRVDTRPNRRLVQLSDVACSMDLPDTMNFYLNIRLHRLVDKAITVNINPTWLKSICVTCGINP